MYGGQQNMVQYAQMVYSVFTDHQNRSFHLTKLLGGGNEGGVFLAEMKHHQGKNNIALKIQKKMRDDEKTFIDKLIQYQHEHENPNNKEKYSPSCIIRIYERFNWNNQEVVMMEIGDIDLYTFCNQNKKKMSLLDKQNVIKNIVKAIHILHKFGYFHRDIKAENFIRVGAEFKLCDFGLIKQMGSRLQTYNVGTPMFKAPELINIPVEGEDNPAYNEKVDMWALGCLLYEILKEEEVFKGKTEEQILEEIKAVEANPQIIKEKIQQLKISQAWINLLTRMFNVNFEDRISSSDAFELIKKENIFPELKFQPTTTQTYPFSLPQGQQKFQQNNNFQAQNTHPNINQPVCFPLKNQGQQNQNVQDPQQQQRVHQSIQNTPNKPDVTQNGVLQTEIIPKKSVPTQVGQNNDEVSNIPEANVGEKENSSLINPQQIDEHSKSQIQNQGKKIDEELPQDEADKIQILKGMDNKQLLEMKNHNAKIYQDLLELCDKIQLINQKS